MISKNLSSTLLASVALFLAACPAPPGGDTDTAAETETDSDTTTTGGPTSTTLPPTTTTNTTNTTNTTTTTTTDATESDSDTDSDTGTDTATTADPDPVCGDGNVDDGEECDDGNTEDGDGCTANCKPNICGDGIVHEGVEICDDGVNDGSYGGCMDNCAQLGPGCGDGILQAEEGEVCDTDEEFVGCLNNCQQAQSCLEIKTDDDAAISGVYKISPDGYEGLLDVYCDMDTDGGGYTFLKVSLKSNSTAATAEAICDEYAMNLFTPRTAEHLAVAWTIGTTENVLSMGNGGSSTSPDYVTMMAIYPAVPGESCVSAPFNSNDCAEWVAGDGGAFYVTAEGIEGEPSVNNCEGCSMEYAYDDQGTLVGYAASKFNGGYKSAEFFCDVGDKLP